MNDIVFTLGDGFKFSVRLVLDGGEPIFSPEVIGDTFVLTIKNPPGLGYGIPEPQHIGTLNGRRVYALLRIFTYGAPTTSFSVNYTFYLGEVG